jgi:hypothetical protein
MSESANVERHDSDEPAVCVGQWCCGCREHPTGKPWGWNHEAWQAHYESGCHPIYTVPFR